MQVQLYVYPRHNELTEYTNGSVQINRHPVFKNVFWHRTSYGKMTKVRLNMKMSSYQYKDPHVKDKRVSRPYYL